MSDKIEKDFKKLLVGLHEDVSIANPLSGSVSSGDVITRNYSRAKGTSSRNLRYVWLNPTMGSNATLPIAGTPCLIVLRDQSWAIAVYREDGDWETIRNPITGQQVRRINNSLVRAWTLIPGAPVGTPLKKKYWRDVYRGLKTESKNKGMKNSISGLRGLVSRGLHESHGRRLNEEFDDEDIPSPDEMGYSDSGDPFEDDLDPVEPLEGEMGVGDDFADDDTEFEDDDLSDDEEFEDGEFDDEEDDGTSRVGYFRETEEEKPESPGLYLVVSGGKFSLATWSPEDETFSDDDGVVDATYWEPLPMLPDAEEDDIEDMDVEDFADDGEDEEEVESEEDFDGDSDVEEDEEESEEDEEEDDEDDASEEDDKE